MMNTVNIIGRLGQDPELKKTRNGKAYTKLSLAVERDFAQDGQQSVDWIPVMCWGKIAEFICGKFGSGGHQGDTVAVSGSLNIDVSGNGDNRKYYTKVTCSRLKIVNYKSSSSNNSSQDSVQKETPVQEGSQVADTVEEELEVPF